MYVVQTRSAVYENSPDAPTFGQETGDGPDSLVPEGRRAGAGHTAPFDLMHPERIRARRDDGQSGVCASGNGVFFRGCQPKKKVCKDEGGNKRGWAVIRRKPQLAV